jgi:hypothetical protein
MVCLPLVFTQDDNRKRTERIGAFMPYSCKAASLFVLSDLTIMEFPASNAFSCNLSLRRRGSIFIHHPGYCLGRTLGPQSVFSQSPRLRQALFAKRIAAGNTHNNTTEKSLLRLRIVYSEVGDFRWVIEQGEAPLGSMLFIEHFWQVRLPGGCF